MNPAGAATTRWWTLVALPVVAWLSLTWGVVWAWRAGEAAAMRKPGFEGLFDAPLAGAGAALVVVLALSVLVRLLPPDVRPRLGWAPLCALLAGGATAAMVAAGVDGRHTGVWGGSLAALAGCCLATALLARGPGRRRARRLLVALAVAAVAGQLVDTRVAVAHDEAQRLARWQAAGDEFWVVPAEHAVACYEDGGRTHLTYVFDDGSSGIDVDQRRSTAPRSPARLAGRQPTVVVVETGGVQLRVSGWVPEQRVRSYAQRLERVDAAWMAKNCG